MGHAQGLVVFVALLAGCGGSSPTGTGSTGSNGSGSGGCSLQITGLVNFTQEDGVANGDLVIASFASKPYTGVVNDACEAACRYTPHDGGITLAPGTRIDVGNVTASDETTGISQALTEQTVSYGSIYDTAALSWNFADTLQIAGGTGGFPAFSISVLAPAKISVLTPSTLAAGQTVVASQAQGLTVTWAPSTPPASFMSLGIDTPAGEIDCYPADSTGTATIAPSVLANLAVGTYARPAGFSIGRWNVAVDSSTDKTIGVQVEQYLPVGIQITP